MTGGFRNDPEPYILHPVSLRANIQQYRPISDKTQWFSSNLKSWNLSEFQVYAKMSLFVGKPSFVKLFASEMVRNCTLNIFWAGILLSKTDPSSSFGLLCSWSLHALSFWFLVSVPLFVVLVPWSSVVPRRRLDAQRCNLSQGTGYYWPVDKGCTVMTD